MLRSADPNLILIVGTLVVVLLSLTSLFSGLRGITAEKRAKEQGRMIVASEPHPAMKAGELIDLYMVGIMHGLQEQVFAVSLNILRNRDIAADNTQDTFEAILADLRLDPGLIGRLTRSYIIGTARSLAELKLETS